VVTDASGTFNETVRHAAWVCMSAAGAQLMNWFSVACELRRDWRNDISSRGGCVEFLLLSIVMVRRLSHGAVRVAEPMLGSRKHLTPPSYAAARVT
jgi:hypothetical protein